MPPVTARLLFGRHGADSAIQAEEVLYTKMMQYPDLRAMLLQTGHADLVFSDSDTYWGDGKNGQGLNKIGHALMNVRERLRAKGVDT